MQTQRINITLPIDLARDLRTVIPNRQRSKFIADVLKEKLSRNRNLKKEWIKSLRENRELNKKIAQEIEEDFKYADAEVLSKIP